MLIQTKAGSRWHRDPEIQELIDHLKQPERNRNWGALTKEELEVIAREVDRCQKDFIYAARNYFWIRTKKDGDKLFSLWPGQELILQKILELKSKGIMQKLILIKARQLGASTLVEGLIAWRTIFFHNANALVVSYDRQHTADVLFPIMLTIYDRLPWWLQPMCAMRKADEGLWFHNPDPSQRDEYPGNDSRVFVKAASSTTGVGQGMTLSGVHISEFADFEEKVARAIIDEDMTNALVEGPDTFAILESTAKGANTHAHHLWKRSVERLDEAEWYPLFLPFFFENSRRRVLTPSFKLEREDKLMREKVMAEWVRCNDPNCHQYHARWLKGEDRMGILCPTCNFGRLAVFIMADEQLYWMQHRRRTADRDEKSMKKLLQEQCVTAEESFQLSGVAIFGVKAQNFANMTAREPIAMGHLDRQGRFHGCNKVLPKQWLGNHEQWHCYQADCDLDHEWDINPLLIWEWPQPGAACGLGADVAEGLGGKKAYSVGTIIRLGSGGSPDIQVATWRSNTTEPYEFAENLFWLGKMYNDALMAIECNRYDTCFTVVRQLNYPNLYRWKHVDSINPISNKLGWWTNMKTRPRMWQTLRRWLSQELLLIRSKNCVEELKNFVKDDEDDTYAGGDRNEHDDECIALMIALYTLHEDDWSDSINMVVPRAAQSPAEMEFTATCKVCMKTWGLTSMEPYQNMELQDPEVDANKQVVQSPGLRCACGSRRIEVVRNERPITRTAEDNIWSELTYQSQPSAWTPEDEFYRYSGEDHI